MQWSVLLVNSHVIGIESVSIKLILLEIRFFLSIIIERGLVVKIERLFITKTGNGGKLRVMGMVLLLP